ncbi:MAG: hypothetical protein KKD94_04900 [Nanoarchaeota archaeon]|nr:hypothetical protein [Nanoarchaeota archaeon]MBU1988788.1 hypothetical protein [Nanoarchaeota archaeon]
MANQLEVIAQLNLIKPTDMTGLSREEILAAVVRDNSDGSIARKIGPEGATYAVGLPLQIAGYDPKTERAINTIIEAAAVAARREGLIPTEIKLTIPYKE